MTVKLANAWHAPRSEPWARRGVASSARGTGATLTHRMMEERTPATPDLFRIGGTLVPLRPRDCTSPGTRLATSVEGAARGLLVTRVFPRSETEPASVRVWARSVREAGGWVSRCLRALSNRGHSGFPPLPPIFQSSSWGVRAFHDRSRLCAAWMPPHCEAPGPRVEFSGPLACVRARWNRLTNWEVRKRVAPRRPPPRGSFVVSSV